MAVLGRVLFSSAERVDLADLLSIDSFVGGDFKFLLKSLVGDTTPYVLKGFDVINPNDVIGSASVSIRVADSVVYYPASTAGSFFYGLKEGDASSQPLIPELRKSATNYVYLTLTTTEISQDTRAFWDPDQNGGAGGEFTQDVNTESVLKPEIGVSTASFPEGTVPLAKIVLDANFIISIEDARNMMFRLGAGGINPDPFSRYAFRQDPSAVYARQEPNTKMSSALDPNPFQGGDKNIQTLKEWMDAIMTKLAELGGTVFWYEDTGTFGLVNMFLDTLGSSLKSKGKWSHDATAAGQIEWTEDLQISSLRDNRDVIIRAGSKTLADQQVMYLDLVRGQNTNTNALNLDWINGSSTVNGSLTAFENLSKGDWIKKQDDSDSSYVRVEEFYSGLNLGGGTTTPALALSVLVSENYSGLTETRKAVYQKGIYTTAEVQVGNRSDSALQNAGGNFYWLSYRTDVIQNIASIATTTLSLDIANHDGTVATCTVNGGGVHGLIDGQAITISTGTNFLGTYKVEVLDTLSFSISVSGGPFADETASDSHYAIVTTSATSSNGTVLNSANHALEDGNEVLITNTTNYNNTAPGIAVKVISDTSYSIPVSSALASESAGTSTLVLLKVRSEAGASVNIVQGETINIGEVDGDAIRTFIGMNAADTHPFYAISPSYNTISGQANYNGLATDNLTERISKLTAMMANKAQDKTVKITLDGIKNITNTTNGLAQDITFVQRDTPTNGTLEIIVPSTVGNTVITLDTGFSLLANQAAYFSINRNITQALAISSNVTVADLDSVPLDENVFILAYRLSDTDVSLWDGSQVNDFQNALGLAKAEVTTITNVPAASITDGQYWTLNSASDITEYYVWHNKDAGGSDPAILGKTGIEIAVTTGDANTTVAAALNIAINALSDFSAIDNLDGTVTITNSAVGITTDAANVDVGGSFGIIVNTQGTGEALHYVANGDLDTTAIKKLDESVFGGLTALSSTLSAAEDRIKQNRTLKLIEGGAWSWVLGTTTLTWSADAQVQIGALSDTRNNILAGSASLATDGDVAYVDVNRLAGAASNLTVNIANISAVTLTDDTVIIARRTGSVVLVGSSSFQLKDGEFLELDGGLAEINKYHGQLAILPEAPISKRITISGSDILKLSGAKISLEQKNLLLNFPGAVVDFGTGEVFETDGTTPFLGGANDFTPSTIGASEYFYYSISILPNVAQVDNTISGQVLIIPAASSNIALVSAPKAAFPSSGIKLGNLYVQEDGAGSVLNINHANIIQLGVGGSGSGSGDANADLTVYRSRLNLAPFNYANTNIASIDESGQIDGVSTAAFDIPSGNFKFADSTAQVLQSTQQLDQDFLDEGLDISTVELYSIWDLASVDTAATYEATRDGVNWQALTSTRIGNSDSYRALHKFTNEPSNAFNQEYAVANADAVKDFDDNLVKEQSQKITVAATTIYKNVIIYINKATVNAAGRFCVEIVKDVAGAPSTDLNDSVWTSAGQNISTLSVGNNVTNISGQFVLTAGDYHLIVRPDDAYRVGYTANNADKISLRTDASAGPTPNIRTSDGTTWSAEIANETAVYRLEGRVLDVRVRVTSAASAGDKFLSSYGLFYKFEDSIEFNGSVFQEKFIFDGTVDNDNEFILTNFLPDSRLLMCFALGTGQVFRYGDFVLDGHKVIFPPNTFNVVGNVELEFFQNQAVDGVASTVADALLTANHLASTDAGIDKGVNGRGFVLKNASGAYIEIGLDEFNNFTFTIVG